ncbi:MAG: uroporphyrinogen-III synthase [Actinomycetes bacterium]
MTADGTAEPASPGLRVDQLRGFRIGVTSDRRSGDLIAALERRGAQVLHAPALTIAPNDQDSVLVEETRALIAARPDTVLVTTGYGMRRWFEVADAAGLGAELTAVLDQARVLARGPKALGAVRAAGLEDAEMSAIETTASLVDRVVASAEPGGRVGIQLHGYTDEEQLARLRAVSERVLTVTPYRWVAPASTDRLPRLIEAACSGLLDAVTFTSAPGADATLAAARALGLLEEFVAVLRRDVVAVAVGPVTAGPLREAGIEPVLPDRYRMGALIRLVCEHLERHRVLRLRAGEVDLELRGRGLTIGKDRILLGPNALALFRRLAESPAVVSRAELISCLPDHPDDHVLEVAMSRLRRTLGMPDLITTVVKRGYRLNAVRLPAAGD